MNTLAQVKEEIANTVNTINNIPSMNYGTASDRALYRRFLDRKLARLQEEREALTANIDLEDLFFNG